MPGAVLNAFHSVSHLISQSNYSKTHTRIPILLMSKREGRGGGAGISDTKRAAGTECQPHAQLHCWLSSTLHHTSLDILARSRR